MIDDIICSLLDAVGGAAVESAVTKRRERKARAAGRVRGAMRLQSGEANGIGSRWKVVEAEPLPRALETALFRLDVVSVRHHVHSGRFEQSLLGPDGVVLELITPSAVVEWAIPATYFRTVVERLGLGAAD